VRVVLDTNVLVQAALSPFGPANGVIALVFIGQIRPLFDERILGEYDDVLTRSQFAFRATTVEKLIRQLRLSGIFITPYALTRDQARLLPDVQDAAFLEVAISGKADAIITSNMKHFPSEACAGVSVLPPSEFLQKRVHLS
jgi:uncharacterized protein